MNVRACESVLVERGCVVRENDCNHNLNFRAVELDQVSPRLSHRISFVNEREIFVKYSEKMLWHPTCTGSISPLGTLNMRDHIMPFYQNVV